MNPINSSSNMGNRQKFEVAKHTQDYNYTIHSTQFSQRIIYIYICLTIIIQGCGVGQEVSSRDPGDPFSFMGLTRESKIFASKFLSDDN